MITLNTNDLTTKLGITAFELEWVIGFLERNETGLFRFSPRQLEILTVFNGNRFSFR